MTKTHTRAQKKHANQNRRWIWIGAVLGIIAILVIGTVLWLNDDEENQTESSNLSNEVSVQEAATLRDEGAFVLDVREPEEWNEFHIPGATLIPLGELPDRLSEVPQDQQIVVVCRSGNRSQQGRDILLSAGFEQVTSMAGGVSQWRSEGYPTETGS